MLRRWRGCISTRTFHQAANRLIGCVYQSTFSMARHSRARHQIRGVEMTLKARAGSLRRCGPALKLLWSHLRSVLRLLSRSAGASVRHVEEFAPAFRVDVAFDDFAGAGWAELGADVAGEAVFGGRLVFGVLLGRLGLCLDATARP